ncbi:FG-GAP-like repeat-containing protein [Planctomycetaceae bacterium]|nr:FG-GAP-like repeat-containing protein [Planctomycetaceae bacterium]
MSYNRPVPIEANGEAIDLGHHVVTRCYDWDQDGNLDLLVGGGDGRLWLYRNSGTRQKALFEAKKPISAGGRDRWGDSYTGVVLINLVGNALPDLAVCHSGKEVTIHQNVGTAKSPKFAEAGVTSQVQENCQGRFDVADWDGDGLADLVTGSFGGKLEWYRNEGKTDTPTFGPGKPFFDLNLAYNSHPRIVDFNQDGRLDLLLGVNWGTVSLYLNIETAKKPSLSASRLMQWSDGKNLNIRELNGDDTTPELADLDGDGVLDLISGGKNGRLFFMRGIGFSSRVETFQNLLAQHSKDFGKVLRDDAAVRQQAFGALASLQADLAGGLIPLASREQLFKQLAPLAKQYPRLLGRSKFDLKSGPHLPLLAGQYWVVLLESLPDSSSNRQRVADALGFRAGYERLLIDLGVLLIDNYTATPEHLAAMHRLMMAMPRAAWDVETITVAGWLGPAIKTQKIRSRSGINIFDLPLGRPENSFAGDAPRPGFTDVFLICLAHELAHNMLDTVGKRTRPELYERKFEGLAQAAGSQVVYQSPKSRGIDMVATKANFQRISAWDGDEATWRDAWVKFFKGKEVFDRAYTRGNVQFFLDAPQEAFATLANQYFADSQLMLDFCKVRWDAGHRSNINQFLLIADYLSGGKNKVSFYVLRPGGDLTISSVKLTRDAQGRITQMQSKNSTANFKYQDENLVTGFRLVSTPK